VGPETGGMMLIIAGVAFILARFGAFGAGVDAGEVARWLPLLVVYIGARDLRDPAPGRPRTILPLVFGIWLQISALNVFGFDFLNSWPLLVILTGLGLIVDSILQDQPAGASARPGG
jgi:hypothetical protein